MEEKMQYLNLSDFHGFVLFCLLKEQKRYFRLLHLRTHEKLQSSPKDV